jgi:hypothetical protein
VLKLNLIRTQEDLDDTVHTNYFFQFLELTVIKTTNAKMAKGNQDRQYMYNVTLKCVRATIVAVERQ